MKIFITNLNVSIFLLCCAQYYICLDDIRGFTFADRLELNPDKTEFILIGSQKNHKQLVPQFPVGVLGGQLSPAQGVGGLGVVFNSSFDFSCRVSWIMKSAGVHARRLCGIRPLLGLDASVLLAGALVSSRLDYCNSVLLSLTDFVSRRLQLVQSSLCRVVTVPLGSLTLPLN